MSEQPFVSSDEVEAHITTRQAEDAATEKDGDDGTEPFAPRYN